MRSSLPRKCQKEIKQKWSRQYEELEKIVNEWSAGGAKGESHR